jgi:hypothetical protein
MVRKSSLLGGERAAMRPSGRNNAILGPSDSSDSGSDIQGELEMSEEEYGSDSDSAGTGERAAAEVDRGMHEGADIGPDRIDSEAAMTSPDEEPSTGDLTPAEDELPEPGPIDADFTDLADEAEDTNGDEDEEEEEEEDDEDSADQARPGSPSRGASSRRP